MVFESVGDNIYVSRTGVVVVGNITKNEDSEGYYLFTPTASVLYSMSDMNDIASKLQELNTNSKTTITMDGK